MLKQLMQLEFLKLCQKLCLKTTPKQQQQQQQQQHQQEYPTAFLNLFSIIENKPIS